MVKIPNHNDPTLVAADAALVGQQRWRPRPYLGMSGIGRECSRQLWYEFRWLLAIKHSAQSLKYFADGDYAESLIVKRLRAVEGVTLLAVDPATGYQYAVEDFGSHFKGHTDGLILGLLQASKTTHVFEAKCVNEKKYMKAVQLKNDIGEKNTLEKWDGTYFAQAQLYMRYMKLDRHYTVIATPGVRNWVSVRTEYNKAKAEALYKKAERIIFSQDPPERISEDPCFYLCKWCVYSNACHDGDGELQINCRTCMHATPTNGSLWPESGWHCGKHGHMLDYEQQLHGCDMHRFIPSLIHGEQIDAAEDASWILYRLPDGSEWLDGERK